MESAPLTHRANSWSRHHGRFNIFTNSEQLTLTHYVCTFDY